MKGRGNDIKRHLRVQMTKSPKGDGYDGQRHERNAVANRESQAGREGFRSQGSGSPRLAREARPGTYHATRSCGDVHHE